MTTRLFRNTLLGLTCGFSTLGWAQEAEPEVPAMILAADAALEKRAWDVAANAAAAVLNEPDSPFRGAALARLGAALDGQGQSYAALTVWVDALKHDNVDVGAHLDRLLELSSTFDEDVFVGQALSSRMALPMSNDTRAGVALRIARSAFSDGEWGTAMGMLPLVPETGPLGREAMVLKGVILTQQGKHGEALAPLLAARQRADREGADPHEKNTLTLNVARTFYASGNYGRAMEYYARVPRSDAYWPQAHFERAWAHFRSDDMPGVLGLLNTHTSPFFEDWYWPEAEMLRAQSLFLMCKFPAATDAIDAFQARYEPMEEQIGSTLGKLTPENALVDGRRWLQGESTALPAAVMRPLSWDKGFQNTVKALDTGNTELQQIRSVEAPWAAHAGAALAARLETRSEAAGRDIIDTARDARAELRDLLEGLELTRVDLLTLQSRLFDRAAAGEKITYDETLGNLRKLRRKGKRVWPFQGEYWADELGWYVVTARPECPTSVQVGD
ncbi:MAG: tetratricopeptide repeat protein [Myxococcota bacterium]